MKKSRTRHVASIVLALLAVPVCAHPLATKSATVGAHVMAARVRTEFLHAWSNYRRYAWGHDELRPLSRTPHDWYGPSLLMTPVDALDTLVLMGLKKQADDDRELIATR